MSKAKAWAVGLVGAVLVVGGVVLRLIVDGRLTQIPLVIAVFGGLYLISVAVRPARKAR
ncbi:hypothetical protein [Curtobacterium sp. MCBD17_040]|uniref:hypothetical protein n=1 Tax=Curtobacterium sp. MCBD17_040 TaxID=2175674 RepID=UPI0015E8A55F|nr:hypothetical protein [Curtobacterium sp. MCBD17_040]WIB63582.1 hypothetical protein DEI94_15760 [Curtobacterium sp. MCBD17_040]